MNKEEFLNKLRKKLNILEDKEVEDIISEYEGYIEEKVNAGLTEEEAVKELGNINEIVSDLLAAYKVKTPEEDKGFNGIINKISEGVDTFIESLNNKSAKDVVKILIEILLILALISIIKIPFEMISDLGRDIFLELNNPIGAIFSAIWKFLIEISYVIISIMLFIKIYDKRYLKDITEKIVSDRDEEKSKTKKEPEEKSEIEDRVVKKPRNSLINIIVSICTIFLKIIVIIILIGVVGYLLGTAIALGFAIYLIAKGVTYYGILILLIAMFLGGTFFLELGLNFCLNKRIKAINFFSKLTTLIILTGVGLSLSAIEIANTEIIYDNYFKETKTISKEVNMTKDLTFYNYDKLIVDDTLENIVKIEYVYPDIKDSVNLTIDLEECGKGYCLETNVNHMRWSKAFLNDFIKNLKDKKIYTYEFEVKKSIYASLENINLIKENNRHDK